MPASQRVTAASARHDAPNSPVSKQIALDCTTEQIAVDEQAGSARKVMHEAWRCAPAAAADLAETPSVWVLGKGTCLETSGGRGGPSYQRCKT